MSKKRNFSRRNIKRVRSKPIFKNDFRDELEKLPPVEMRPMVVAPSEHETMRLEIMVGDLTAGTPVLITEVLHCLKRRGLDEILEEIKELGGEYKKVRFSESSRLFEGVEPEPHDMDYTCPECGEGCEVMKHDHSFGHEFGMETDIRYVSNCCQVEAEYDEC